MITLSDLNSTSLDHTFPFGKHAGTKIRDLPHPYVRWFITQYDTGRITSGRLLDWLDDYIDDLREMVEGAQLKMVESDTLEYTLSPSQEDAADGIVAALEQGERFFRLEGGAGYGKSFAVRDIVKRAILMRWQVKATAVSYVATQVLESQLNDYAVPCMTLARAIGLDKVYDGPRERYVMGDRSYAALETLFDRPNTLLVLDEYSMVNDDYAEALGDAALRYQGAILVVGDLKQLPPVNQSTDCTFSTIPAAWNLTDPMRYSKDSDLYRVEQAVRHNPNDAMYQIKQIADESDEVMVYATSADLLEAFKRTCVEFPHDDNRILYYRRADVIKANNAVRKALFGDDPAPLEPGERLLVVRTSDCDEVRYYTGTTLDVMEVSTQMPYDIYAPTDGFLYATLGNGQRVPILFAINENKADPDKPGGEHFNRHLKELAGEAEENEAEGMKRSDAWQDYREYKDSFVFVAYNYATTVHKAQGATVDRVFVSPAGLIGVPQVGDKLTYVALTRAKREVHAS